MRRHILAVGLLGLLLSGMAPPSLRAQIAVPAPAGRVTDTAGVLSGAQRAALEETLRDFERRKGSQVAVLLLPTTQPETIEQFSIRVADTWKLGRKGVDDGAILLLAVEDRALRIETGYGLEGALPDAVAKRIVDEVIAPRLRAGDLPGGIRAGVDAILRVVEGEPLPPPQPSSRRLGGGGGGFVLALVVFFVLVNALGWLWRAIFGRLLGAGVGATAMGALAWFMTGGLALGAIGALVAFVLLLAGSDILPGMLHSGRRGGGGMRGALRGGGGWGGLGGGGFGGGGFGGGGGGFGGGGASGRW